MDFISLLSGMSGANTQAKKDDAQLDLGEALQMFNVLTGADTKDVTRNDMSAALTSLLPQLLNGAVAQSESEETKEGFNKALDDHSKDEASSFANFMKNVDIDDGSKIVKHLLGSKQDEVVEATAKKSGLDAKQVAKIAAVVAPLLMSTLGKANKEAKSKDAKTSTSGLVGKLASNPRLLAALASAALGGSSKKGNSNLIGTLLSTMLK
ncbi:MAG: DUF937 domain-containing protein [Oscillospiraceae bacterium]|nr:DUF937 domain-containing protein [Oscillospiraceae bacterium]